MSLFQHSVLNKYLKEANQDEMDAAFQRLKIYFHNPVIQQNIRESKEEQFQEGFLRELFVTVLGYTINPTPDFNITTEFKNERGAKKADGAILKDGSAIAVIELKSTKTKDLESIRLQAFDYKANQSKCVYVITSNFEKVRFYINNAVDFEEFDLFKLKYEEFQLLWLCLAKENLLKGIPLTIKEASILKEENITKQIYVDYSLFKRELYADLIKNNLELEIFSGKEEKEIKLLLFKKSQKLLDRFLFIFFGEDRGLLPPNSISEIIKQWENQSDWGDVIALYDRYKKYFHLLNTGWKGKKYEIFAYNGGLFAPDEILDSIIISDEVLQKHTKVLTAYDFETDVDVNILGHIFENSLNEIEEITTKILSETMEHAPLSTQRAVSKRKKDGVFYTPKYITKYIVENTVGKLCDEKKAELAIEESEYLKSRKGRTKKKLLELSDKLDTYRNWLLTLTICDPACGSGAFLNQALDYLIREHNYIDELKAKLLEVPIIFTEVENSILENNIFGVDINEESVEIAKLSLWLRTAQKGRKLTTLSNNIKCGNSLIDDPEIAGEKAFNWKNEFPDVFRKKKKQIWHITTATHNSRYSQRMFDNHILLGKAVWLSEKEELIVTQTIADIARSDELNILEYNICGDHFHLLLVCEEDEVPKIVQKIKSVSARKCNIEMGRTIPRTREQALSSSAESTDTAGEHAPRRGKTQAHLWTQKFGHKKVTSDKQLENTIDYIKNNRNKHQLPENKEIQSVISEMLCTHQHASRTEYSGGFDVVIGNPPYVQLQSMGEMSNLLKNCGYETFHSGADLYCLFTERGYQLLNNGGMQSFIMPNKWMLVAYGKPLRKFLSKTGLHQVLNFGDIQFFQEATTYVCILAVQKSEPFDNVKVLSFNRKTYYGDFISEVKADLYDYPTSKFDENQWSIQPYNDFIKLEKMKLNSTELKDLPISIYRGILTGYNDAFYIDKVTREKLIVEDDKSAGLIKPMVRGRDIIPYGISEYNFLINVHNGIKTKIPPIPPIVIDNYSAIKKHLDNFYPKLEKRGDKGDTPYNLRNCAYLEEFSKPKIIYPNMTSVFPFMYDEAQMLTNQKCFILTVQDESISLLFLTSVFNSTLAKLWIWYNCPELQGGTREISKVYFEHFPVPKASEKQRVLLEQNAKRNTRLTASIKEDGAKFLNYLKSQFEIETFSKKLQNWHELEFGEFIKELNKAIKVSNKQRDNGTRPIALLTKTEEMEWMEVFETKKVEAQNLKSEIDKTDREIDQMVYELYGLTEEEIGIVEGS